LTAKGVTAMMMGGNMYFNIICEELCITGGKVIHVDRNVGEIDEVHKIVSDNYRKYPNGKWEMYVFGSPVIKK